MGLGIALCIASKGIVGTPVECQAHIAQGLPRIIITGAVDSVVQQAKMRLRSAFTSSGYPLPNTRIHLLLSQLESNAGNKIHGNEYDLALALAIWKAYKGSVVGNPVQDDNKHFYLGGLSLDGRITEITDIVSSVLCAYERGATSIAIPYAQAVEISQFPLVNEIDIIPASTLAQVIDHYMGVKKIVPLKYRYLEHILDRSDDLSLDMADVIGQEEAKYRFLIAAIGGHHTLVTGPAGVGKTMIARRFPTILPPLYGVDLLRAYIIRKSISYGEENYRMYHQDIPHMIAPHHSISSSGFIGNSVTGKWGAAILAHHGVLFLDECAHVSSSAFITLQTIMQDRSVTLSHRDGYQVIPADFQLILATNYCECSSGKPSECICDSRSKIRFKSKIPVSIVDKIDIHIDMYPTRKCMTMNHSNSIMHKYDNDFLSNALQKKVIFAREKAVARWGKKITNCAVSAKMLAKHTRLSFQAQEIFDKAELAGKITHRCYERILTVAWSIADLHDHEQPSPEDIYEAFSMRCHW